MDIIKVTQDDFDEWLELTLKFWSKPSVEFQQQYDSWIAAHAIFLTPTTAKVVWGYYHYLIDLLEQYPDISLPKERWIEIRNVQVVISKFLWAEIGVFNTIAAGSPELEKH